MAGEAAAGLVAVTTSTTVIMRFAVERFYGKASIAKGCKQLGRVGINGFFATGCKDNPVLAVRELKQKIGEKEAG